MSTVDRRPTLQEIRAILGICTVSGATEIREGVWQFHIEFNRDDLEDVPGWSDGLPKPTWLLEEIRRHLHDWQTQQAREAQWVSKEEELGSSIDTLTQYWAHEMGKARAVRPETVTSRLHTKVLASTVLRLKELQERRTAGGVYSATEDRREKARKTWREEEFEGPKREEEQRKAREKANPYYGNGFEDMDAEILRKMHEAMNKHWERMFEDSTYKSFRYGGTNSNYQRQQYTPPSPTSGKIPWYTVLGVSATATKAEITKAHRKLVKQYQPRTSADADDIARTAKMAEINVARDAGLAGL